MPTSFVTAGVVVLIAVASPAILPMASTLVTTLVSGTAVLVVSEVADSAESSV